MIEPGDPKITDKPLERCTDCDREVDHYNVYVSPTNEKKVICWQCTGRAERGFNTKPDFYRDSRRGPIPR